MSCRPAARVIVPEAGATPTAPWGPSLFSTRTLSTYTFMASSLTDVKVVGPGVVMLIIPVQRATKLVVGTLAPNDWLAVGAAVPKLKVFASPAAAATAAD